MVLLASLGAARAQDLSPATFLQRGTSSTAGAGNAAIPVQFRVSVGLSTEYNSNVTLSNGLGPGATEVGNSKSEGNVVDQAELTLSGQWAPTQQSQIALAINVGYQNYLHHPDLDGVTMSLPSTMSYSFSTGDVKWTIHNDLAVSNNPASQPALSGVQTYQQVVDTAGLNVAWAAGSQLVLTAGYDFTFSSTSLASSGSANSNGFSNSPEFVTHTLNLGAIYDLAPKMEVGLGTTLADTVYLNNSGRDSTSYTVGPFFHASLTPVTEVFATAGFQTISVPSNDQNWYGDLKVTNNLNPIYTQTLDISHSLSLGVISDTFTLDSVQYTGALQLRRDVTLLAGAFVEHGIEGGGSVEEHLILYGGNISLQLQLTRSLSATLEWQDTVKISDIQGRNYTQDLASLSLSWTF